MAVYAFASRRFPVKIVKVGKVWAIYKLKEIVQVQIVYADPMKQSEMGFRFEWEKQPFETWSYKPFEDKDVSFEPTRELVEQAKTWCPHLVNWNIPTTILGKEARGWVRFD